MEWSFPFQELDQFFGMARFEGIEGASKLSDQSFQVAFHCKTIPIKVEVLRLLFSKNLASFFAEIWAEVGFVML